MRVLSRVQSKGGAVKRGAARKEKPDIFTTKTGSALHTVLVEEDQHNQPRERECSRLSFFVVFRARALA